jgi:hypothetical protein
MVVLKDVRQHWNVPIETDWQGRQIRNESVISQLKALNAFARGRRERNFNAIFRKFRYFASEA